MKIIVGMTGATGSIYALRLLKYLKAAGHETSLIISPWAEKTCAYETGLELKDVCNLADSIHMYDDLSSPCASGSFRADAFVVLPCSMKTLAGIANGYADNLIVRTADVFLKERRPLILVPRETPFSLIHINNMRMVTLAGGILIPPMPAFYHKPETIEDIVDQTIGKILDMLRIENNMFRRWEGFAEGE